MKKSLLKQLSILLLMVCVAMPAAAIQESEADDLQQSQVEMEQNQIAISVSGTTLRVKNADGLVVEIFSLTGEKVYTQRIEGSSKAIELGQLQRGFYIVRIGKFTRKIYLR